MNGWLASKTRWVWRIKDHLAWCGKVEKHVDSTRFLRVSIVGLRPRSLLHLNTSLGTHLNALKGFLHFATDRAGSPFFFYLSFSLLSGGEQTEYEQWWSSKASKRNRDSDQNIPETSTAALNELFCWFHLKIFSWEVMFFSDNTLCVWRFALATHLSHVSVDNVYTNSVIHDCSYDKRMCCCSVMRMKGTETLWVSISVSVSDPCGCKSTMHQGHATHTQLLCRRLTQLRVWGELSHVMFHEVFSHIYACNLLCAPWTINRNDEKSHSNWDHFPPRTQCARTIETYCCLYRSQAPQGCLRTDCTAHYFL